jgi:hypothetical protein
MDAIQYKQYYIAVKIQFDGTTRARFQIVGQISRDLQKTDIVYNWIAFQEFTSDKAAYEFGLQRARAWIDEHG